MTSQSCLFYEKIGDFWQKNADASNFFYFLLILIKSKKLHIKANTCAKNHEHYNLTTYDMSVKHFAEITVWAKFAFYVTP